MLDETNALYLVWSGIIVTADGERRLTPQSRGVVVDHPCTIGIDADPPSGTTTQKTQTKSDPETTTTPTTTRLQNRIKRTKREPTVALYNVQLQCMTELVGVRK
jgi:type 1 fimbria pilin